MGTLLEFPPGPEPFVRAVMFASDPRLERTFSNLVEPATLAFGWFWRFNNQYGGVDEAARGVRRLVRGAVLEHPSFTGLSFVAAWDMTRGIEPKEEIIAALTVEPNAQFANLEATAIGLILAANRSLAALNSVYTLPLPMPPNLPPASEAGPF